MVGPVTNNNLGNYASKFYADTTDLERLPNNSKDPQSLKRVAKEFEAVMMQIMLQTMREAEKPLQSKLMNSDAEDTYKQLYDKQMASNISKVGGIGLSEVIERQLAPRNQISPAPDHKE